MGIADVVIILVVAAVVIAVSVYLRKAKKRGETCIGCPYAKQCGSKGKCNSKKQSNTRGVSDQCLYPHYSSKERYENE